MKKGCLPSLLLGSVTVIALFVALVAALNVIGCCAIDCEEFPEKCAENERRQEAASLTFFAALTVAAGSATGAIHLRRRGSGSVGGRAA